MTRRRLVQILATLPFINLLSLTSQAKKVASKSTPTKDLPLVDLKSQNAKNFQYVHDGKLAKGRKKPTDHCANCFQWNKCAPADEKKCSPNKDTNAAQAPCPMFPGHSVANKGWCMVYAPQPAKS